jgi:hypothetical protein
MKSDRLDKVLHRNSELLEEHRARLDAVQRSASLLQRSFGHYGQLLARTRALLQQVRSRIAGDPEPPPPGAHERALKAAMAAWDAAMLSSSKDGRPTHAAIAAYRSVSPEPMELVREKVLAIVISRVGRRDGTNLH